MSKPTNKATFIKYCLRRLGAPVVEINVSDDQIDDRVDDALDFYRDYHYDGSERTYLKHQVTQEDIDNKYLTVPANIMGVINVFPIGTGLNTNNMFNIRYQITLNDVYDWSHAQIQNYASSMERIGLLQELFVGKQPLRFNRHTDKLHIDMDWSRVSVGEYIVAECYQVIDSTTNDEIWGDWWLRQYATALIKKQWGENLKKFEGMQLPGGITFNGQTIWNEANEEIQKLEEEVQKKFSMPAMDMIG